MNKKKYTKKYNQVYFKSEKGVLKRLFHHMKERSKKHNWHFSMTYETFEKFAYEHDFKEYYNAYVLSGYNKMIKPSVDRIDDMRFYTLDNIRFITWRHNWKRGLYSEKNKKNYLRIFSQHREKIQFPISMYRHNTLLIFKNMNECISFFPFMLKSKISLCIHNKRKHHHGWRFKKGVVAQ